ncbi:thioredoxin family protein [Saprospiraceae bacterium]|nr:thioredoxin family protein [Saprospiraceae bacterium]
MMNKILFSLLAIITIANTSYSQLKNPVKWKIGIESAEDGMYNIVYKATAEYGWTIYSQHTSDDGPVPTEIVYEDFAGISLEGDNIESGHKKEGPDPLFENVNVVKYLSDQAFVIKQKISVKDASIPVIGYLTYMTCDNKQCLPPTDVDFNLELPAVNSDNEADSKPMSITMGGDYVDDTDQSSGILNPVTWKWTKEKKSETQYKLVYTAAIQEGWTVYSQFTSDDGPVPTEVYYENAEGITLDGKSIESGHKKEGPDPLFDNVNVVKYLADQPLTITQNITLTDRNKPVSGYLTYMACDATKCLPPTDVEFSFLMDGNSTRINNTEIALSSEDKVDQSRPQLRATYNAPVSDCGAGGSGDSDSKSFIWLFFAGMLGGFAALMTPCVFPMIPITVSFFTKDTKRSGLMNGLIYGLSIIVIYVALGLLITIFAGPEALNALSTNWIANIAFFVIFIVFAFSFFGYYELTLPSSWTTKTDSMADKGGLLGIFFMAATLSLVSFSCTGPIVGSALVAAANGGYVGPLVVMLGFSLALALPFGLFAAFPSWLNSLPRSGGWMNSVKVVLGFLEVGFAFKFLSTADLTQHWGILPYEVFMGILIAVAVAIALYLFGFIKFPHDSKIKKLSNTRKILGATFAVLAIYLCTGFTVNKDTGIYNSLWLTSGFSPPVNYNLLLEKGKADETIKAKYPSFTKCANNIDCFKNYFEGLEYAKEVNKPVFVDFTGHGCQNCRRVEDQYWVNNNVRRILNDEVVLVSLYVDDREALEKPFISAYDDKKKRNVGNQWADFQVVNFERNSQPWYTLITTEEQVITQPQGFDYFNSRNGAETYTEYLECGLKEASKLMK